MPTLQPSSARSTNPLKKCRPAEFFRKQSQAAAREEAIAEGANLAASVTPSVQTPTIEVPLTEAQMEIWLSAQTRRRGIMARTNESFTLSMRGDLDVQALRDSLNDLPQSS